MTGDWRERARCRELGVDTNLFYPGQGQGESAGTARAVAVCVECPVKGLCLAWALEHDEAGIWGGTTEKKRASMKRAARRLRRLSA